MKTKPGDYVFERQVLWAMRHGKTLLGSAGDRGRPAYTTTLEENLFEPLASAALDEYRKGDGGELGQASGKPGKMQAVHSSSALSANLFHYWRRNERPEVIAEACGLPTKAITGLAFEQHLPIDPRFRYAPNLDAVFTYGAGSVRQIGVECKLSEPFSSRTHLGLKPDYLEAAMDEQWRSLPTVHALARELSPNNTKYEYLDAAQLLKHVLGLRRCSGDACRLLYLYYDVPGSSGVQHAEEIAAFAGVALQDGVTVLSATYQDVILRLGRDQRVDHAAYVDYLTDRYL